MTNNCKATKTLVGAFEDHLISNKICKNRTNHPHLLRVADDRKFVKINSFHASADEPLLVNFKISQKGGP